MPNEPGEPTGETPKTPFESLDPVSQNRELHLFVADSLNQYLKLRSEAKLLSKTLSRDEVEVGVPLDFNLRHKLHYANIPQPMKDFIGLYCKLLVLHGGEEDFKLMVWHENKGAAGIFSRDPEEVRRLEERTRKMVADEVIRKEKTPLEKHLFVPSSSVWKILAEWNKIDGR